MTAYSNYADLSKQISSQARSGIFLPLQYNLLDRYYQELLNDESWARLAGHYQDAIRSNYEALKALISSIMNQVK